MIDINNARLVHMKWLIEMENALRKGKIPTIEPHQTCKLGRWISSHGIKEYDSSPAMAELKIKHKQFHSTADEMTDLFREKNYVEAEVLIRELNRDSKDLIFLLTRIEMDAIK
jgi:hypothetical protein